MHAQLFRSIATNLATSGVILAIGLGAPTAIVVASDGEGTAENPAAAANRAERASRDLARGRIERALAAAEDAVAYAPNDASHRVLLGNIYMSAGRFASAASSFEAAEQLGATDRRAVIGRVLSLIATGHQAEAHSIVEAHAQDLPASDYGLALALAGDVDRGGLVITDIIRSGNATPRDRQNLAFIYALAGRWLEARLVAAQDLGPARVGPRIEQWAAMLQSNSGLMRVAALMQVTPQNDGGMPVRLALRNAAPVTFAANTPVDPAPVEQYAPPPPVSTTEMVDAALAEADGNSNAPAATPVPAAAPVVVAAAEVPAAVVVPTPAAQPAASPATNPPGSWVGSDGRLYVSNPVVQQLRRAVAMVAPLARPHRVAGSINPGRAARAVTPDATPAATTPARTVTARLSPPTGPVATSGWVVQLGAYDSLAIARGAWTNLSRRHASLSGHDGVTSSASVGGRTVFRLSATGFASRSAANGLCASVRHAGGNCFVRSMAAGENVRWASRTLPTRPTRVAAR